jgi:hypothetical protein
MKNYELTLTFKLSTITKLHPKLGTHLNNVLSHWNDGRYPLDAEILSKTLRELLEHAMSWCLQEDANDKYGHEMVPHDDGNGETSKAFLEAKKEFFRWLENDRPWLHDSPEAKIERVLP